MGKIKYFLLAVLVLIVVICFFSLRLVLADSPTTKAETKTQSSFGRVNFSINSPFLISSDFKESLILDKDKNGDYQKEREFLSSIIDSGLEFNAVGPHWREVLPVNTEIRLEIRVSSNNQGWSDWFLVEREDIESQREEVFGDLVAVNGQYLQYKVTLKTSDSTKTPVLEEIKFTFINSSPGLLSTDTTSKARAVGAQTIKVISRTEWGADPKYMTWDPEYVPVKKFILHHTAGTNNPSDPKAHMRAIYYYHAVTHGWGDIGYNFVIDQYGNIYEGRYGGDNVIGAHAGCVTLNNKWTCYNAGSCGIAVMGTFVSTSLNTTHIRALTDLIAWKGYDYKVEPIGQSYFNDRYIHNVAGHRDVNYTACPGDVFYKQLSQIRTVAQAKYNSYIVSLTDLNVPQEVVGSSLAIAKITIKNNQSSLTTFSSLGIAVRYGAQICNFEPVLNVSLRGGESKTFTFSKSFYKLGTYEYWAYYYQGNQGYKISENKYFRVFSIQDKLELTSSQNNLLAFSPNLPVVGEEVTTNFILKNNSDADIVLDSTGVAVRYGTRNVNFPSNTLVTIPANSSKVVIQKRGFSNIGSHKSWIYYYYKGVGYKISNDKYFEVVPITSKVKLTSFSISPNYPIINKDVTIIFTLQNESSIPITLDSTGVAVRYGTYKMNFQPTTNIVIPANSTYNYSQKKSFNILGTYKYWAYYYYKDVGYKISNSRYFTAYKSQANPQLVSFSGSSQLKSGERFNTSLVIKNLGDAPTTFSSLGIAVRYGAQICNFEPVLNVSLRGGESKTFTFSKSFYKLGTYEYWAYYYQGNQGYKISENKYFEVLKADAPVLPPGSQVAITANGDFEVKESNLLLTTCKAGEKVSICYNSGWFYVKTDNFFHRAQYPVRIVPKNSAIIEVISYKDFNWDNTINFNRFRGTIEVCKSPVTGKIWVVNELPLELYLRGIAEAGNTSPAESLKTMATAYRSYALAHLLAGGKHKGEPFHLKNSRKGNGCDQTYVGYNFEKDAPNIVTAVKVTSGKVVTYNGKVVITPFFSGTDGVRTRSWKEVWGGAGVPWCVSVADPYGYISNWKTLSGNHMVGLSAKGVIGYASRGKSYDWILAHYYTGTKVLTTNTDLNIRIAIYQVQ